MPRLRLPRFGRESEFLDTASRIVRTHGLDHARGYALCAAFMIGQSIAISLSAWVIQDVVNRIFLMRDAEALWIIGGVIILIYLAKGLCAYGESVTLAVVSSSIVAKVQKQIFEKMLTLDMARYDGEHSTDFISRQSFIGQATCGALNLMFSSFCRDFLTVVGLFLVMFHNTPTLSLLSMAVIPAAVLGIGRIGGRVKRVVLNEFQGFQNVLRSLAELSRGIRVVRSFQLEGVMRDRQSHAITAFQTAVNKLVIVGSRSSPLMETLGGVSVAIIIIFGGWRVIYHGDAPGGFFSFIASFLFGYEPVKRLARVPIDLTTAFIGVRMLHEFLDRPGGEAEETAGEDLEVRGGELVFDDVRFRYRDNEPVLRGMSFVAAAGEVTALVGRSGGGKTTALELAQRFYEPSGGQIRIDGRDIAGVRRASLRRAIAHVGQDPFLFAGTIADNIGMGRPGAGRAEIEAAARAANAHDFIMEFERGYDSPCGENGVQLSGGQCQRLTIARAFLKDAPILLLDEPTSALDTESDLAVRQALRTLRAGRTTLVVAHRLSTIVDADRIHVVDQGRVIESGRHEELIARRGAYHALCETRFADTIEEEAR